MKKAVMIVGLVLILAMAVFGQRVTVEFWHAMGGGHGEALAEIVEMFNQQNPAIKIEAIYVGNYNALQQKILASVQSDTLPVISQAYSNWTSKLLQSDVVQEISSFINDPVIGWTQAQWEDIWKPFREMGTWGDTVYGVPFNKSVYVMYYNTDLLDFSGLDIPTTMDELYAVAKELTVDETGDGVINQYGIGFRSTVDHFTVFLLAMGGEIMTTNPDGTYTVTINSQEARNTFAFMKKMMDEGIAFVEGGYLDGPFGDGRIAIFIETVASKPYVDRASVGKHDWNWAAIPTGVTFRPPFAGTELIMYKSASDQEKAAAWEFMKFLTSPTVTTFWSLKTGYVPVRKSALDTSQWKTFVRIDPKAGIPVEFLEYGYSDPKPNVWEEIRTLMNTLVQNVLHDKWTIDEGLQITEAEILKLMNQ